MKQTSRGSDPTLTDQRSKTKDHFVVETTVHARGDCKRRGHGCVE